MQFRKFAKSDFDLYVSWFDDPKLNQALGPAPDHQWLRHILGDPTGIQYSVVEADCLIAVVGVCCPIETNPFFVITDLAVSPTKIRSKVGSRVLRQLINEIHLGCQWQAFVELSNSSAKSFFEANGWLCESGLPDSDGMYDFRYPHRLDN